MSSASSKVLKDTVTKAKSVQYTNYKRIVPLFNKSVFLNAKHFDKYLFLSSASSTFKTALFNKKAK